MKKLIILLIILSSTAILLSQNPVDPKRVFNKDSVGFENIVNYQNNQFMLRWNWGSIGRGLDDLLDVNFYHSVNLDKNSEKYAYLGATHNNTRLMQPLAFIIEILV